MATTAAETLSEVQIFRHQAGMIHGVVRANVDGVTQEESLIQPQPGGNCLNWVLGHLLCIYGKVLPMLGQERVLEESALKQYDRGAPPLSDSSEALEIGELMTAWDET